MSIVSTRLPKLAPAIPIRALVRNVYSTSSLLLPTNEVAGMQCFHLCLFRDGVPHVTITQDAMELCRKRHFDHSSLHPVLWTWDVGRPQPHPQTSHLGPSLDIRPRVPHPKLPPYITPYKWHLVVITGDLIKLVHLDPPPPPEQRDHLET